MVALVVASKDASHCQASRKQSKRRVVTLKLGHAFVSYERYLFLKKKTVL
jgi:hypothetical protein